MRNTILAALAGLALTACPAPTMNPPGNTGGGTAMATLVDVTEPITTATTWTKDKSYVLKNIVYVDGAVLTIQPGTKVLGERGSALVVTRTGQLIAEGTAAEPIVFTANYPVGTATGAGCSSTARRPSTSPAATTRPRASLTSHATATAAA